jgi:hypothetical protein
MKTSKTTALQAAHALDPAARALDVAAHGEPGLSRPTRAMDRKQHDIINRNPNRPRSSTACRSIA